MFQLCKNNFTLNGICHYEDEFGNKATIRRTGDISFVAKLRFATAGIKASPMHIDVQKVINEGILGDSLHLDYSPGAEIDSASAQSAITSFTELIQYWISLFSDLRFSWCDNNLILKHLKADGENCAGTWCDGIYGDVNNATVDDIYNYKYSLLTKYKELEPILSLVTSVN